MLAHVDQRIAESLEKFIDDSDGHLILFLKITSS
jgi:hypothetical protein